MFAHLIIPLNLWPRSRENPIYGGAVGAADCTLNPCAPIRFRRKQKVEIDRYLPAEWNRLESRLAGEISCIFYHAGNGNATRGSARVRMERLRRRKNISQSTGRALQTGRLDQNIGAAICSRGKLAAAHVR